MAAYSDRSIMKQRGAYDSEVMVADQSQPEALQFGIVTSEGETNNVDPMKEYAVSFSAIENIEQQMIQHIRTSGIRKQRETSLIDEVMELRRERRKLFATLSNHVKSLNMENNDMRRDIKTYYEKKSSTVTQLESQVSLLMSQKQQEQVAGEVKLREQLQMQEEKLKFIERMNLEKIKKKCEEKIKLLEGKVNEIISEKEKADSREAKKLANDLVEMAKLDMEKKSNDKIEQYKQSMVAIAQRESDLTASLGRYKQLVHTMDEENSILKSKVKQMESVAAGIELRERDIEMSNSTQQAKYAVLEKEVARLLEKLNNAEKSKDAALKQQEQQHQKQLEKLDEKVRKMLMGKDNELGKIRGILRNKEGKLKVAEDALAQINQEIVGVRKR